MKMMTKDLDQFAWTAWFSLIGGLAVMAMLPTLHQGLPGVVGGALMVLAGLGATMIVARGWFMLSMVSKDRNGAWPAWGPLQVLPWVGTTVATALYLAIGVFVAWWFGGQMKTALVASLAQSVAWRDLLVQAAYVVPAVAFAWRAPKVWLEAAGQARALVAAGSAS